MKKYLQALKETLRKEIFSFLFIPLFVYIICSDSYNGTLDFINFLMIGFIILESYFIQQTFKESLKNDFR